MPHSMTDMVGTKDDVITSFLPATGNATKISPPPRPLLSTILIISFLS